MFAPNQTAIAVVMLVLARSLIPLMQEQGVQEEEAALSLGAGGLQTFFASDAAEHQMGRVVWRFAVQCARNG